jgi:predicted nucleic acid-binding protein
MTLFVDTTAFYALLDADDASHAQAARAWIDWLEQGETFLTTNYILIESWSLLQRRLGLEAVRAFNDDLLPIVEVEWVGSATHELAARVVLASGRRPVSLVDRTSFEVMRQLGVRSAFTFDRHFADEGFDCLP